MGLSLQFMHIVMLNFVEVSPPLEESQISHRNSLIPALYFCITIINKINILSAIYGMFLIEWATSIKSCSNNTPSFVTLVYNKLNFLRFMLLILSLTI